MRIPSTTVPSSVEEFWQLTSADFDDKLSSSSDDSSYDSSSSSDSETALPRGAAMASRQGWAETWMEDMDSLLKQSYVRHKQRVVAARRKPQECDPLPQDGESSCSVRVGSIVNTTLNREQYFNLGDQLDSLDVAASRPIRVAVTAKKPKGDFQPTHRRTRSMLFLHPEHNNQRLNISSDNKSGLENYTTKPKHSRGCNTLKYKRKSFLDVPDLPSIAE